MQNNPEHPSTIHRIHLLTPDIYPCACVHRQSSTHLLPPHPFPRSPSASWYALPRTTNSAPLHARLHPEDRIAPHPRCMCMLRHRSAHAFSPHYGPGQAHSQHNTACHVCTLSSHPLAMHSAILLGTPTAPSHSPFSPPVLLSHKLFVFIKQKSKVFLRCPEP